MAEADPAEAFAGQDDEAEAYEDGDLPEVIDISQAKVPDYTPWPRGWYDGVIEEVEYAPSQSKGLPMLTFHIRIENPDDPNDDGTPASKVVRWYLTIIGSDGKPDGRTKAALAKLDPDLDLESLRPGDMDEHFGDALVRVRLTIRPDREDPKVKRNNVADVVVDDEEADE